MTKKTMQVCGPKLLIVSHFPIALIERNFYHLFKVAWFRRANVTSTCLISLTWVNSSRIYLPGKFGGHRCYGNGYINSYINSYMSTELTTFVRYIERFSRSEIPIYSSQNQDMAVRKTRRRAQAIAKRYAFQSNVKIIHNYQNV